MYRFPVTSEMAMSWKPNTVIFDIEGRKLSQHDGLKEYIRNLHNSLYLLDSDTGTGKTYFIGTIAKNAKVLVASPFVSLGDNIMTELLKQHDDVGICNGSKKEWHKDIVVSTYDQIVKCNPSHLQKFDYIFVDEPQVFYEDTYRELLPSVFNRLVELSVSKPVIALSATLIEDLMPLFNTIKVYSNNPFQPRATFYPVKTKDIHNLVFQKASQAISQNKLYVVLFNNKPILEEYNNHLTARGIECTVLHSNRKNDPKVKKLLTTQVADGSVLLMTKAGQAGLSVLNTNLMELDVVFDDGITPQALIQLGSRFREDKHPNLNILYKCNLTNKKSLTSLADKLRSHRPFDVPEHMADFRSQVVRQQNIIRGMMHIDNAAEEYIEKMLIPDRVVPEGTTPLDILSGNAFNAVVQAQAVEEKRRRHLHNHLGAFLEELPWDVDCQLVTGVTEQKETKCIKERTAELKRIKQDSKKTTLESLIKLGCATPGVTADAEVNKKIEAGYKEANELYLAMQKDGALAEQMPAITERFGTIGKYKDMGYIWVRYPEAIEEATKLVQDSGIVGLMVPDDQRNRHIDLWIEGLEHSAFEVIKNSKSSKKLSFIKQFVNIRRTKSTINGKRVNTHTFSSIA